MSLSYCLYGDAKNPAVVLLHGFLGHHGEWDACVAQLEQDFLCIVIDLPGHGRSVLNDSNNTLPRCAEAIDQLLEQLNIKQCHLLGYSMGGRIALCMALAFPHRYRTLILEGSCPGLRTEKEQQERKMHDEAIARRIEKDKDKFDDYLQKWYEQPFFKSLKNKPELFAPLLEARLTNDPLCVAASLRALGTGAQPSLWDRLSKLTMPVFLIVGEHDDKFRHFAHDMKNLIVSCDVEIVGDCGHNVHVEKTSVYVTMIRKFWLKHKETA